ncbi:MAG: hypothetical protein IPG03_12885 [Candidatus Microthrix sp.]|nr:hypothetical protein [Candidatus Microthrix sp.]MBK6503215.1 hypothetical protein [Candidatus Microthrix sp.]
MEPAHVIWRRSAPDTSRPGSNPDVAVTLCSLGSAVQPAGPAEQYADREALAEVMVAALVASAMHHAPPGLRSAIGALAAELRSGNLVDLASAASSLDHLADDAAVAGPFVQGPGEGPPPRQAGRSTSAIQPTGLGQTTHHALFTRSSPRAPWGWRCRWPDARPPLRHRGSQSTRRPAPSGGFAGALHPPSGAASSRGSNRKRMWRLG